jgi:hypothetical protein
MTSLYSLTIPVDTIKALCLFAARKDIRYYLQGAAVDFTDPGAPVLVATDGHRMLCVDPIAHAGNADPVALEQIGEMPVARVAIVPVDTLLRFKPRKIGRSGVAPVRIELSAVQAPDGIPSRFTRCTLSDGMGQSVSVDLVDGKYPDWQRVLPSCDGMRMPADARCFAPEYIGAAADAAVLLCLCSSKYPGLPVSMGRWVKADAEISIATIDQDLANVPMCMPWVEGCRMIVMPRHL